MNTIPMRKPLIASLCGALLAIGAIAPAHADRDGRGPGRGWDRGDRDDRGDRIYYRYGGPPVVRERVIIREYPRPYYGGPAVYYGPPPPPYAVVQPYPTVYSRSPSVVIGINVPPLVIPLR